MANCFNNRSIPIAPAQANQPTRNEKLTFLAEWFQKEADMTRSFNLAFYPYDNTVELFDHRSHKLFMRRSSVPTVSAHHLFLGAKLNIFGRQYTILDYADTGTRTKLSASRERTFCLLKPPALRILDRLLGHLSAFGLVNCLMVRFTQEQAIRFLDAVAAAGAGGDAVQTAQLSHLQSGAVVALELVAPNAVARLREMCGPEDVVEAKRVAPGSLRALYGRDGVDNCVHCAASAEEAERQVEMMFGPAASAPGGFATTALIENTTFGLVKPHAVLEGKLSGICGAIYGAGLRVTAMKMHRLARPSCEEFYEVYKGVVPEYEQMVQELASGACLALEVQCEEGAGAAAAAKGSAYAEFRKLCGPANVDVAKQLRPDTIRARFGVSNVQNAIHCTDLEEDTRSEIAYFFKIL